VRHILLGIIWRKTAADPAAPLLRFPRQAVEMKEAPAKPYTKIRKK